MRHYIKTDVVKTRERPDPQNWRPAGRPDVPPCLRPDAGPDRTVRSGRMYGRTITGRITGPWTGPKTGPTSDDDNSQTVHPNYLKFGVRIVLYQVSCHTKFQLIRMNGSRVIDVGTYSHNSTVSYGRNSLQYWHGVVLALFLPKSETSVAEGRLFIALYEKHHHCRWKTIELLSIVWHCFFNVLNMHGLQFHDS